MLLLNEPYENKNFDSQNRKRDVESKIQGQKNCKF